jgi:hypothetical protein
MPSGHYRSRGALPAWTARCGVVQPKIDLPWQLVAITVQDQVDPLPYVLGDWNLGPRVKQLERRVLLDGDVDRCR